MQEISVAVRLPAREEIASVSASRLIPRVIRCRSCEALAREIARQRVSDEEIVVRFECDYCCHIQTRHYSEILPK